METQALGTGVVEDLESVINGDSCINVKVTPVDDEFINQFSDEPLTEDPDKTKLSDIISYLKSNRFKKKVNSIAYKTGIPPKQIAKGVISKAFGIVGDILGIAIDTVSCTLSGLVDLLSNVLHKGIDLITKVVRGLTRIVTFNQTAVVD